MKPLSPRAVVAYRDDMKRPYTTRALFKPRAEFEGFKSLCENSRLKPYRDDMNRREDARLHMPPLRNP